MEKPYAGARVYMTPEWSALAAAESGVSQVPNQPTGVWLDRIVAVRFRAMAVLAAAAALLVAGALPASAHGSATAPTTTTSTSPNRASTR